MPYRFGDFELDEAARTLTFRRAVQPVQPRVFDLLVYLVRNAGRVVPKEELLNALWPDVIVTDSSLQRAVSLARAALAVGNMDKAIRSFVKHGYRFAVDEPSLGVAVPQFEAHDTQRAKALELSQAKDWKGAAAVFESLDAAGELSAADIDVWALAVECQGRPAAAIPVLIRAVAAHVEEGQPHLAARAAVTIAKIELERSSIAPARGWLDRAETLLGEADDPRTKAYLLWMRSRDAAFSGRSEEARDVAQRAHEAALACRDQGLVSLTLVYLGFFNISLGHTEMGVEQQNHAAAIALSSNVDPIFGSLIYCNILWSCRTFPDWTRARQWSEGFDSWCEATFATVPGSCDLHRAEVVGAQRDLATALATIDSALPKLSEEEAWSIGDGYRVRGDIRAMVGDIEGARADYASAYASGWDAEPGNAFLLGELGEFDAALAALDRALLGSSWYHLQRRGILLAHKARLAAASGRRPLALAVLEDIEAGSDRWVQPAVHALVNEARHLLADGAEATRFLLLARQLWTSAGVEYHAARVRLDLAKRLQSHDTRGAEVEIAGAERIAGRIGSRRLMAEAEAVRSTLAPDVQSPEKIRKRSGARKDA